MYRLTTYLVTAIVIGPMWSQTPAARDPSRESQPAAQAGTASLTGVVYIVVNGKPSPIRRARVTVGATDGTLKITDTDTQGEFRLEALKGGTYRVVVDKAGFVPVGRDPVVDVPDGQNVKTTVTMQRGAAIEGRLTTADGEPAVGLTVSAVRLGYGPYGKTAVAVRQTTTDDLGRFRLHTLIAGEYRIEAAPDPLRIAATSGNKPTRTYYAGVSRLNDAQVIPLAAEQQISNVTFTVSTTVLATIAGTITSSTGAPPASFSLRLQRVGGPANEVRCLVLPARPGEPPVFQCPNVPPGDFRLLVNARPTDDANVEFAAMPVTVEGRDVTGLRVTTAPGVPVSGRLEAEGGESLPRGALVVALETEYEFPGPSLGANTSATPPVPVGTDGSFTFSSVAGPRVFRLQRLPEGWALKAVTLGGTDVSDIPTTFAASERPSAVRIVVTSQTGSVSGTVVSASRQDVAGTRVVIFIDDVRLWMARSRHIRIAEVDSVGRYAVAGLLPGQYRVAFVDQLEDGAWEDPDVLTQLRPSSIAVTVLAGGHATVGGRIR